MNWECGAKITMTTVWIQTVQHSIYTNLRTLKLRMSQVRVKLSSYVWSPYYHSHQFPYLISDQPISFLIHIKQPLTSRGVTSYDLVRKSKGDHILLSYQLSPYSWLSHCIVYPNNNGVIQCGSRIIASHQVTMGSKYLKIAKEKPMVQVSLTRWGNISMHSTGSYVKSVYQLFYFPWVEILIISTSRLNLCIEDNIIGSKILSHLNEFLYKNAKSEYCIIVNRTYVASLTMLILVHRFGCIFNVFICIFKYITWNNYFISWKLYFKIHDWTLKLFRYSIILNKLVKTWNFFRDKYSKQMCSYR